MTNDRSKKINVNILVALTREIGDGPCFLYIKFSWIGVNRESTKNYFPVFLRITLLKISIPHFKDLCRKNLQYQIRISQNFYIKVTMTVYVCIWFNFSCKSFKSLFGCNTVTKFLVMLGIG